MLNPDEIIETGFEALRREVPLRSLEELEAKACHQAFVLRVKTASAGLAACLVIVGIVGVALKPVSAFAALRESARLSATQPIVHFHIVNHDTYDHPTVPPPAQDLPIDIWRFSDRYIRRQGHVFIELFRDGRYRAYDDRFREGFAWKYDVKNDPVWTADGTIGQEIARRSSIPVKAETKLTERGEEIVYEWSKNGSFERIYVNPNSKLISFAEGYLNEPSGRHNHGTNTIEYPDPALAKKEVGDFPTGLKFQTKSELLGDLNRRILEPEQTKTLAGVRVTLYGVIVFPDIPDGLRVKAIVRGNAGANCGAGHPLQVIDGRLFPAKDSDLSAGRHDPSRNQFTRICGFKGQIFNGSESDDLLAEAPSRLTLRVPVWRSRSHSGGQEFVGYLTFTTAKLFFNVGGGYLPFFGSPQPGD